MAGRGILEIAAKYGIRPEDIVKLGSNENPYGPSPKIKKALINCQPELYPETEELVESLSNYAESAPENVIIGTGMDGVMDTLTRLFLDPGDRTLIYAPTFSYYEILSKLSGAKPIILSMGPDFEMPMNFPEDAKLTFICSPNNPTGNLIPEDNLRFIVENCKGIVFLDEAYAEFSHQNFLPLVNEYENLVVGRTMSKAFGLAGMRLGYALAPKWISDQYRRAAPPFFGVSTPSVTAGKAALEDLDYMKRVVTKIISERERLQKEIPKAQPSGGNFLYLKTEEKANEVTEKMLKRGVIIRDCTSFRGAGDHHIRITVGTPQQNDRFLQAYREITC